MVHTLKRIYLYTAATFALLFTAAVAAYMLDTLLELGGMLPYYVNSDGSIETEFFASPPTSQEGLQSIILFLITAVLVGGLFGGGHYWLIRRDARSDPGADGGPTRHIFLNGLLALAALTTVPAGLAALSDIDLTEGSHNPALALSFALVGALVFTYIFLERGRVSPAGRAAPAIRQIQEDAMQGILLIIASAVVFSAITSVIRWAFVNGNVVAPEECFSFRTNTVVPCAPPPLLSPILTTLFAAASWSFYVWLSAWSRGAVLQRILWYAALGYGVIWLLYGISFAAYTAFAPLFGDANAWQEALENSLPFVGALLVGALIIVPYTLWTQRVAARLPQLREAIHQGIAAIPAALGAAFFLAGLILILSGLVEQGVPAGRPPDADDWATAVGALIAGLIYPPLWLWLRRASDPSQAGPTIPRRVYVLALLAGTAIGALSAAVFMVYQIVASVLGLDHDPLVARQSAVILLVLGAMALYHLWQLRADLRVTRARLAAAQPTPAPVPPLPEPAPQAAETTAVLPETLEAILRDVAAGTLDPASAAARIRSLPKL